MSEPNQDVARNVSKLRNARPRVAPPVEAIRDCITPILTSAMIARSVSVDRRAQLALDIIERQTYRLAHVLEEAFGVDTRPRPD